MLSVINHGESGAHLAVFVFPNGALKNETVSSGNVDGRKFCQLSSGRGFPDIVRVI
jgi:hypothetical protein